MASVAYEKITQAIIERLEAGVVPWRCPWTSSAPRNLAGREYRGINAMMLGSAGFSSPHWGTFKQIHAAGGYVKKGAKSEIVVYWTRGYSHKETDPATGEKVSVWTEYARPVLKFYHVFNAEQTEGLALPASDEALREHDPIAEAESIVAGYQAGPTINKTAQAAFYRPADDSVHVPPLASFETAGAFYDTLFHELIHSTGHEKRLNRRGLAATAARFGSEPYAREELVAELGAAYLLNDAGIAERALLDNEAAYIASWLKRLSNDHSLLPIAAAQATKAADRITGREAA